MNYITDLILTALNAIKRNVKPQTYGSALEEYIVANNPTCPEDVERLAEQFNQLNHIRKHGSYMI